jgi:uncharacterized integral membrane protein
MHRVVGLLRLLALFTVVLLGLALHTRNAELVALDLYFVVLRQPLSLLLVLTLLIGAVLGILAALPSLLANRRTTRRLRRELKAQSTLHPPSPAEGP